MANELPIDQAMLSTAGSRSIATPTPVSRGRA